MRSPPTSTSPILRSGATSRAPCCSSWNKDRSMTPAPDALELRAIRAQAAVWVTDLHGPDRSAELEAGLRRWLAEDPRHEKAFELATEAWQRSGSLPAYLDKPPPTTPPPPWFSRPTTPPS